MPLDSTFGRYTLVRKLATGGMAEIFLAKLPGAAGFERNVVIKKIMGPWSSDAEFIAMLIDEAKIMVRLNHPNIVQVYELVHEDPSYYIVMEYVEGIDLRQLLRQSESVQKKIPLEVALFIITETLEGLTDAHTKNNSQGQPLGIVHRDISPQNILVSFEGQVKITDFGIAKAASRHQETVTGVIKGKFAYMSPEQASQETVDARSDLFSTGVVFYELLTGHKLFSKSSDIETLDTVRRCSFTLPPEVEHSLPSGLLEILLKSLARDPRERYQAASDFRDALLSFQRTFTLFNPSNGRKYLSEFLSSLNQRPQQEVSQETATQPPHFANTQSILSDHTGQETPKTQALSANTVTEKTKPLWKISHQKRKRILSVLRILMIIALIASLSKSYWLKRDAPEKGDPSPPREVSIAPKKEIVSLPTDLPPVVETSPSPETVPQSLTQVPLPSPQVAVSKEPPKESQEVRTNEVGEGLLSVQAIPWGLVFIDGMKQGETPLKNRSLKEGRHRLEVRYEPEGATLSTVFKITKGAHRICIASFDNPKEITCDE